MHMTAVLIVAAIALALAYRHAGGKDKLTLTGLIAIALVCAGHVVSEAFLAA